VTRKANGPNNKSNDNQSFEVHEEPDLEGGNGKDTDFNQNHLNAVSIVLAVVAVVIV
jgi:hypothetical protein